MNDQGFIALQLVINDKNMIIKEFRILGYKCIHYVLIIVLDALENIVDKAAGSSLRLICSGVIDPVLADTAMISWSKQGVPVDQTHLEAAAVLSIPFLLGEHSGVYTCEITTLLDVVRRDVEVRVETLVPRVLSPVALRLGKSLGSSVSIKCSAAGLPPPTLLFKFNGDEYSGRLLSQTTNQTISVLDVGSVGPAQEGDYLCLAVNQYGSSQGTASLDVYSRTIILDGPSDQVLGAEHRKESWNYPCYVNFVFIVLLYLIHTYDIV